MITKGGIDRNDMVQRATPTLDVCVRAPDVLAAAFESIGHLCELGVVQSFCGAESVGLFRFSSLPHHKLMELLQTRLSGLEDPGEVDLFHGADDEWRVRIAHYEMEFHTHRSRHDISKEELLPKIRQRTRFLQRKFIEQLDSPSKIFLRRDVGRSASEICEVHDVLRTYAPHRLLWVDHTDETPRIGSVEFLRDDLLRGYYGYFWPDAAPSPAGLGIWLRVLESGLRALHPRLWNKIRKDARGEMSASTDQDLLDLGWYSCNSSSATRPTEIEPVHPDLPVVRHVVGREMSVDDGPIFCCETSCLQPDRVYVVSAWVWLPTSFNGWVGVTFPGLAWNHMWSANLAQRGSWQRIVTNARLSGTRVQHPGLVVQAGKGEVFFSTGWRVERGAVPNDCLVLPGYGCGEALSGA